MNASSYLITHVIKIVLMIADVLFPVLTVDSSFLSSR